MESLILILFLITTIFTPVIFAPIRLADGYILPQIGIAAIGIALTSIFWIWNGSYPFDFLSSLVFIYFVYLMLSNAWSTCQHSSLKDVPLIFASMIGFLIATWLFRNPSNMMAVSITIVSIGTFIMLYAIGQRFGFDPLFKERIRSAKDWFKNQPLDRIPTFFQNKNYIDCRAIGTIGNTNFAVGYFLSLAPFIAYLTFEVNSLFGLYFLIFLFAVLVTQSRAGQLGLISSILTFVIIIGFRGLLFDWIYYLFYDLPNLLFYILIGIVLFFGWLLWNFKDRWNKFDNENSEICTKLDIENTHQDHPVAHLRYRFRYWLAAWHLIKKRPLCGYGLRTYRKEVYEAQAELNAKDRGKFLGYGYQTPQPRECHNDYIENFVEGGFIGGLLFLAIIIFTFYNFFSFIEICSLKEFLVVATMMAGFVGIMIDVFFFFPLRLMSSALCFWISIALINSYIGGSDIISIFPNNIILTISVTLVLIAMIWETVIKPNLSNWYFSMFNFSNNAAKREMYLGKAAHYSPKDTIYRTHLCLGYLEIFPEEAVQHADVMRQHYDGMTPQWAMYYNSALVELKRHKWERAAQLLGKSLYSYPDFKPARDALMKIMPLVPLPKGRVLMKQATQEGLAMLNHLKSEIEKMKSMIGRIESDMFNVILTEKIKLNIPLDWCFDLEQNIFLAPREIPPDGSVIEAGPARLPILLRNQKLMQQEQKGTE